MDTAHYQASKPQWRFERPHRVRLFAWRSHIQEALQTSTQEMYIKAAEQFSQTDKYRWVESNDIKLDFDIDDRAVDWVKQVRFFANLSDAEYTDYCLRFFDHHDEEWK